MRLLPLFILFIYFIVISINYNKIIFPIILPIIFQITTVYWIIKVKFGLEPLLNKRGIQQTAILAEGLEPFDLTVMFIHYKDIMVSEIPWAIILFNGLITDNTDVIMETIKINMICLIGNVQSDARI